MPALWDWGFFFQAVVEGGQGFFLLLEFFAPFGVSGSAEFDFGLGEGVFEEPEEFISLFDGKLQGKHVFDLQPA